MDSQNTVEQHFSHPSPQNLLVVGNLKSEEFHKADYVAKLLVQCYPGIISMSTSIGHMEFQWVQYKEQLETSWTMANDEEISVLGTMSDVVIFSQSQLRWSYSTFLSWAQSYPATAYLHDQMEHIDFAKKVYEAYAEYISNDKYSYAFMTISLDGELLGQISFQLYKDVCPITCANFLALCTGEKGDGEGNDEHGSVRLWYISSLIHRIVPNGWIQGGDICSGSGDGGLSIYGQNFADECFTISHDNRGILGMVNHGRNTNNSQFYITLSPAKWMDKRYVAFGRVIEGSDVLNKLEKVQTFNERPTQECLIYSCGKLTAENAF